ALSADAERELEGLARGADASGRQLFDAALLQRCAARAHRTQQTQRRLGKANRGAELHQGLVQISGFRALDELAGEGPEPALAGLVSGRSLDRVEAREHAGD